MKSLLSWWKILKTSSKILLLRGVISKIEKILGGDCHRPVEKGNVFRFSEKNKNEIYINIGAGMVVHISFISFCGCLSILSQFDCGDTIFHPKCCDGSSFSPVFASYIFLPSISFREYWLVDLCNSIYGGAIDCVYDPQFQ